MRNRMPAAVESPAVRACGAVASGSARSLVLADAGEAGLQLGVGDPFQVLADRAERAERGQALFKIAAVHLEMLAGQGLDQGVRSRRQRHRARAGSAPGPGICR